MRMSSFSIFNEERNFFNPFCKNFLFYFLGIISIDVPSRYKSTEEKKPYRFSGVTLKAEECVPSVKRQEIKKPPSYVGPACELGPNSSCPASCPELSGNLPPTCPGGGDQGKKPFKYWKELLAAVFLTGVVLLTVLIFFWE